MHHYKFDTTVLAAGRNGEAFILTLPMSFVRKSVRHAKSIRHLGIFDGIMVRTSTLPRGDSVTYGTNNRGEIISIPINIAKYIEKECAK